jgi:hypothetical protein
VGISLKEWNINIYRGILTGFNEAFIIDSETKNKLIEKDFKCNEILKPMLNGRDVKRYQMSFKNEWLINSHNNPPINIDQYPVIKEHLNQYYEKLLKRSDKGNTLYNLRNCAYLDNFEKEKIIWMELSDAQTFMLDTDNYYINKTLYFMTGDSLRYLLAILNSKIIFYYYNLTSASSGVGTTMWQKINVEKLPIPKISTTEEQSFVEKANKMLDLNKKLQEAKQNFINELELEKIPKKLQNFEALDFDGFIKEYKKAKKLKFTDKLAERNFKNEWKALFENDKEVVRELQTRVSKRHPI